MIGNVFQIPHGVHGAQRPTTYWHIAYLLDSSLFRPGGTNIHKDDSQCSVGPGSGGDF